MSNLIDSTNLVKTIVNLQTELNSIKANQIYGTKTGATYIAKSEKIYLPLSEYFPTGVYDFGAETYFAGEMRFEKNPTLVWTGITLYNANGEPWSESDELIARAPDVFAGLGSIGPKYSNGELLWNINARIGWGTLHDYDISFPYPDVYVELFILSNTNCYFGDITTTWTRHRA